VLPVAVSSPPEFTWIWVSESLLPPKFEGRARGTHGAIDQDLRCGPITDREQRRGPGAKVERPVVCDRLIGIDLDPDVGRHVERRPSLDREGAGKNVDQVGRRGGPDQVQGKRLPGAEGSAEDLDRLKALVVGQVGDVEAGT